MSAAPGRYGVDAGRARIVLFGVLLPLLLGPLSQNIVAPVLPSLSRDIGSPSTVHWVVTAYLAAGTAATPVFGRLCDIWGRRESLVLALVFFITGSVVCAVARDMGILVFGRALQGAGGGALNALVLTILADIIPPAERGRYQGWTTATFVIGAVGGPAAGGFVADHAHWSGVFWACLMLGLLSLASSLEVMRGHPRFERREPLDLPSAALLVAATAATLLIFTQAGVRAGCLALAAVFLWGLLYLRLRSARHPLVPIRILTAPLVLYATLSASLASAALVILVSFMPAFLQGRLGLSVSQSGLALTPMLAGSALGSLAAGQGMMRLRRYRVVAETGLTAAILSAGALAVMTAWATPSVWAVETALTLAATGIGAVIPITTFSIHNRTAVHDLGTATAANNFARQLTAAVLAPGASAILFQNSSQAGASASPEGYVRLFGLLGVVLLIALICLLRMEQHPLATRGEALHNNDLS